MPQNVRIEGTVEPRELKYTDLATGEIYLVKGSGSDGWPADTVVFVGDEKVHRVGSISSRGEDTDMTFRELLPHETITIRGN